MAKTRPEDDRPGANRLADYPPMGETTAKFTAGRTAASPEEQDGSAHAEGSTAVTDGTARRTPAAALAGIRDSLRFPGRPPLWFEVVLIAVAYWAYSLIRNAVPEQAGAAMRHADQIWELEVSLGIAVEKSVNHGIDSVTWLIVGMNYYYATLHFIVTVGVLVWLFRSHPGRYAAARLALFATTAFALVGYYFYPLAPPRLMKGIDFIDTVVIHDTWGSMASGDLANVSNQYAAMPSMHIGWSLWCGITIAVLARRTWVRVLGLAYPGVTLVVIVATANHFWLDAVGGAACLAVGFTVAYTVHGRLPHRFPREPIARRTGRLPGKGQIAAPRSPSEAHTAHQGQHEEGARASGPGDHGGQDPSSHGPGDKVHAGTR